MDDEQLGEEIDNYSDGQNLDMAGVLVDWIRDNPDFGSQHMAEAHEVSEEEVEQVLFEVPPLVEARQHPDHPGRTIFWGQTREGRWLFVSCEDWEEDGTRWLRPITAFEPDNGRDYWDAR